MRSISHIARTSFGRKEARVKVAPVAVPAGWPSPAQDYFINDVDLNQHLIDDSDATFIVRVSGDSMIGAGIWHGDEVVVDRSITAKNGDVVVAIFGGELTIKRLSVERGAILLKAENPSYPDIRVPPLLELQIWGVVTYGIRHVRAH